MREMQIKIASVLGNTSRKIRGHRLEERHQNPRSCAVLVPLIKSTLLDNKLHLLLIRRSVNLRRNPGEYAFPGGLLEAQDKNDLCACALREWKEEMGFIEPDSILGLLDDFYTVSGLVITPVVGWFEKKPILEIASEEVEASFYVPLNIFHPEFLRRETIVRDNVEFKIDSYHFREKRIWGATAGIITNLIEIINQAGYFFET
jgi:8-oxo-dGTP pyrophosphatase MutT (NUDIX family)